MLLADFIPNERLFQLKKNYNVVIFEYSSEALELQLLRKVSMLLYVLYKNIL